VCLLVCASARTEQEYLREFSRWIRTHHKTYPADHFHYRFSVFKHNLDLIERHNKEAARGLHSFELGMNAYGDLSHWEFVNSRTSRLHMQGPIFIPSPVRRVVPGVFYLILSFIS
jgi:hypothetical protein